MFNKTKILCLVLISLSGFLAFGKDDKTTLTLSDRPLTAKIRNLKDGKIEFILKAGKEDISIYQEWNSWGWYARSFVAYDKNHPQKKYLILRRSKDWNRNYPSQDKIKAGHDFVTIIDICDGTWFINPKLKDGQTYTLLLRGCFDIPEEKQNKLLLKGDKKTLKSKMDVFGRSWSGHIETDTIEISVTKDCIGNLIYDNIL